MLTPLNKHQFHTPQHFPSPFLLPYPELVRCLRSGVEGVIKLDILTGFGPNLVSFQRFLKPLKKQKPPEIKTKRRPALPEQDPWLPFLSHSGRTR